MVVVERQQVIAGDFVGKAPYQPEEYHHVQDSGTIGSLKKQKVINNFLDISGFFLVMISHIYLYNLRSSRYIRVSFNLRSISTKKAHLKWPESSESLPQRFYRWFCLSCTCRPCPLRLPRSHATGSYLEPKRPVKSSLASWEQSQAKACFVVVMELIC